MLRDESGGPARAALKIFFGGLLVAAFVLFVLWRTENPRLAQLRLALVDAAAPVLETTAGPSSAVLGVLDDMRSLSELQAENGRLRERIRDLDGWRDLAQRLEEENARLRALAEVALPPRLSFVTAEVIGDAGGPFAESVLVSIGRGAGVADGAPALDASGLVGRAVGVGETSARVLLLTDPGSRVPVRIGDEGVRAILVGDETPRPRIEFAATRDDLPLGARVETSGQGGVFPKGLLVGRIVADADGSARVQLAADLQRLDFLRMLRAVEARRAPPPPGGLIWRNDAPELGAGVAPEAPAPTAGGADAGG